MYDRDQAYRYLVQTLGRKENIPQRFNDIREGAAEIIMCMKVRYGRANVRECVSLLKWHLEVNTEEQAIWGKWRKEFKFREVIEGSCNYNISLADAKAANG